MRTHQYCPVTLLVMCTHQDCPVTLLVICTHQDSCYATLVICTHQDCNVWFFPPSTTYKYTLAYIPVQTSSLPPKVLQRKTN